MYALYVCIICMHYMYALYVCIICMHYMYALYVCIICMHYMYALYVCIICMHYMDVLYVCIIIMYVHVCINVCTYVYTVESALLGRRLSRSAILWCHFTWNGITLVRTCTKLHRLIGSNIWFIGPVNLEPHVDTSKM